MRKILFLILTSLFFSQEINAQTVEDSIRISTIKWAITDIGQGIRFSQAQVENLYNSTQNISIIDIDRSNTSYILKTYSPDNNQLITTSDQARYLDAIAAINGTYFDMKNGGDVNFHRMNGKTINRTDESEFRIRAKGAFCANDTIVNIIEWNKGLEKDSISHSQYNNILVSGPLLVDKNQIVQLKDDPFVNNKHPRSCVAITKDGNVIFIVFDGRHTDNAEGVNLHELAHFMKQIGAEKALNLDGGGSSTLYVKGIGENGVVNMPSDNKMFDHEGERKLSSIIYVN